MPADLTLPPEPFDLVPNIEVWPAEKPIIRVHNVRFGATEFNAEGGGGRFHPIASANGKAIPTLYGSNTVDGALSETVFHDIPIEAAQKQLAVSILIPLVCCTLSPKRPLRLIQLRGHGLKKLSVTRKQLIETDADRYSVTRACGIALHDHVPAADGLIWMSRQHDSSEAIVLFGTRVARRDLEVDVAPRALYPPGEGWNEVASAAEAAGIVIVFPQEV